MATVINVDPKNRPVVLSTGLLLAPGDDPVNVDTELPLEAALIERKILKVVDPDAVPPAPEDPYASTPVSFYAYETQPIGMALGSLWLDLLSGELNRLVPEG